MGAVTQSKHKNGRIARADKITAGSLRAPAGKPTEDVSLRRAATVAGVGLLILALLAFASVSAFNDLVVDHDAARTAGNILHHDLRFRIAVGGFVVVAVLDVVVAWALYVVLRPVNRSIAVLAAWLRVAYAAAFAAASSSLVVAARLATDGDSVRSFGPRQLPAQVMTSVNAFQDGWDVALFIFGLHLLVVGYLVFRSSYIPSALGVLVMIAGLGYLIDSFGTILSDRYNANVAGFTFAGEVLLMGWLLWRGRTLEERATTTELGGGAGVTGGGP